MKKLVICILCSCIFFVSCKNNATAEKFYLSAVDSYAEHDFENALVFLKQAKKQDSSLYQAQYLEGKILFFQNKYEDAAKIFEKLVKKYPQYTDSRLFLIRCNIFLGNLSEAEKKLNQELSFNSTDWRIFYLYSMLYGKQNQLDKQLMMLNRTELAIKDTKKVYDNLAFLWDELGVRDKAVNYKVKSNILIKED
ncbi:MAG: tetratricopeptide repeat protein [Clostridia bacterium]|nr:tetratricopeptide repeat protein [Clostridia bacterium]MBP3561198.1 tetratricopeptide repeat protein [Treponema sp.]